MMNLAIKISILEDNVKVSSVLRDIINADADFKCCFTYVSAEEALAHLPENPCDILIVDIRLPGMDGITAIKEMSQIHKQMQFCIFTVYEDDDKIFTALEAGAKGYILKNSEPDKLLDSLRELHKGGAPMSPFIARRVIDRFAKVDTAKVELPISEREEEVLTLLIKGLTYKQIGEKLFLTPGTIKQHLHRIYGKLQVTNKTQAINKLKGE